MIIKLLFLTFLLCSCAYNFKYKSRDASSCQEPSLLNGRSLMVRVFRNSSVSRGLETEDHFLYQFTKDCLPTANVKFPKSPILRERANIVTYNDLATKLKNDTTDYYLDIDYETRVKTKLPLFSIISLALIPSTEKAHYKLNLSLYNKDREVIETSKVVEDVSYTVSTIPFNKDNVDADKVEEKIYRDMIKIALQQIIETTKP